MKYSCLPALAAVWLIAVPLQAADEPAQPNKDRPDPATLLERFDRNKDGFIDRSEAPDFLKQRFDQIDQNKDGKLSRDELQTFIRRRDKGGAGKPGEVNAPAAKGERIPDKLRVGDPAPDFTLPLVSRKGEVTLSSFTDRKPVVLIFGSYT